MAFRRRRSQSLGAVHGRIAKDPSWPERSCNQAAKDRGRLKSRGSRLAYFYSLQLSSLIPKRTTAAPADQAWERRVLGCSKSSARPILKTLRRSTWPCRFDELGSATRRLWDQGLTFKLSVDRVQSLDIHGIGQIV